MIVDAFNARAFELSLGIDAAGEDESSQDTIDVAEGDVIEIADCAPALAVAEQTVIDAALHERLCRWDFCPRGARTICADWISAVDAQDIIMEAFNERATVWREKKHS